MFSLLPHNFFKMQSNKFKNKYKTGAAMMLFTLIVFFASMTIIMGISSPAIREFALGKNNFDSKQAYLLAESAVEDAYYRIKNSKQIGSSETLVLGNTTATTTITTLLNGDKEIFSIADLDTHQRKTKLVLTQTVGVAFNYGMQTGTGGVVMNNSSSIIGGGNLYSDGPIVGSGSSVIQGTAVSSGPSGSISGVSVGVDAIANSVTNSTISGSLYCQSGSGNNKSCNTSYTQPATQAFPISDQQIIDWKSEAEAGGSVSGFDLVGSDLLSLGPKKITGNVSLSNTSILTVDGVLWITGNLTLNNSSEVKLSSSFGVNGGMIIVDGIVSTNQSAGFEGSGTTGSYIIVLSTNTSDGAILINNSAGTVILMAPNGGVELSNNSGANQVTARLITLNNSSSVTYKTGLVSTEFSSGPSGAWGVRSWGEVE